MVVAMPVGGGMADGRPPGVYYNVDRKVATVVFDGLEVDPAVLAPLEARLAPWGMLITAYAGEIEPPPLPIPDDLAALS
jgi:hypothetical protein